MAASSTKLSKLVCHCTAYPFPHRPLGGKCTEDKIIREIWDQTRGECRECPYYYHSRSGKYGIAAPDDPSECACRDIIKLCPNLDAVVQVKT